MADRIVSTIIVIPDWGIWAIVLLLLADTILTLASVVLRSILLKRGLERKRVMS